MRRICDPLCGPDRGVQAAPLARQNGPVPVSTSRPAARLVGTATAVLLLSSGCAFDDQPALDDAVGAPTASPSSTVEAPPAVRLTPMGTQLSLGQTATVVYEGPSRQGTVLGLTPVRARPGSVADFSGFVVDRYTRASTPYYVDVIVTNTGEGRVGGAPVPLWGVDGRNRLLPPAAFAATFEACPSSDLPQRFAPGDRLRTCLVYLSPDHGSLRAVSFRPDQQFRPIVWEVGLAHGGRGFPPARGR